MNKRIAIFEDSPIDRLIYDRKLALLQGVEYVIFESVEDGLKSLETTTFDLIIIHIHFWGTYFGFKIFTQVRKHTRYTPVIATTAFLQDDDYEKILKQGFSQCLEKPEVFDKLDYLINQHTLLNDPSKDKNPSL